MPSHYTSSLSTGPSVFDQSTTFAPAYPDLIHDSKHPSWQLDPVPAQDQRTRKTKKKHHSRKHKKHRSKKHKFAAYIVQLIGVLCLILAALKSFEPLAGIGFTLVVIGYDSKKLKKKGWVDGKYCKLIGTDSSWLISRQIL